MKKKILTYALSALACLTSCSDWLDINHDPNTAEKVDPGYLFNYVAVNWAGTRTGGDFYIPLSMSSQCQVDGGLDYGGCGVHRDARGRRVRSNLRSRGRAVLVSGRGGGRRDPYCAAGALRRGCGLRVRPVSAAQSALGAADEPWLSDFLSGRVVFGAGISGPCGIRRGPAARAAADRAFAAGGAAGVSGRMVDQKGRGINAAKNALPHDRVHLLHRGDDGGVRAAAL